MEGTRPNAYNYDYGGHPAPIGASPTQPYKCGQYVKVKIKVNFFISALAKVNASAVLILTLKY